MEESPEFLAAQLNLQRAHFAAESRVNAVEDILRLNAAVKTEPGFEAPAFDFRGDAGREDREVADMFVEDLVGCFADARARFDVLGSWAEGVEDGGEVVDGPVGLVEVGGCGV